MKQVEQVEVQYIKKTTALVIAVICLVAGFFMGHFYSGFDSGNEETANRVTPLPQKPQASQPTGPMAQRAAAVLKLKQETAANPKNADAWARLGHAYFDMNEYQNAIDAYRKYLELKPDDPNVWTDLGVMYRRSGYPAEAVRAFDRAIAVDPRHQQSRFNKGIVQIYDLNNRGAGIDSWRELLKINPSAKAPNGRPVEDLIKEAGAGPGK
jgi:cytochrome c-type biogenesis protein CcmH/NrfG